jgi:aspartyl-tRNA(Asn)/glutamyl-tRNA(Gln) amidotransferase subunit A
MTDRENQGTVIEIARRIRMDETTAVAVVELCLRQIKKVNPILNAFVEVFEEEALQNASIADAARVSGRELGPLHGVPVALKANLDIKGRLTTSCCAAFRNNRVTSDAACVERLRAAGAIIIGQTNMHELAYGGTGEVSSAGPALNPWDQSRNAGGSSSGSAVAVASGMVPAALGTDTGGSVRIPAAACGLVGFKPTINSISTKGVMPLSWTMDHVGPLTRNVTDALVVASAMAEEGSPLAEGVRVGDRYRGELKPLKVGFGRIPGFEVDASVGEVVNEAMEKMQQYGYMLKPFNLAYTKEAHVSWLSIMYSEASAYYARALEKHYEEFAPSVRVQLEAGRHISSVTYLKAQRFRTHYER